MKLAVFNRTGGFIKKLILAIALFFLIGDLYAQQGPASQNRTTQQIQTQQLPRGVKVPSLKPDPRLQLGACSPVGHFDCDMERVRFRKCERDGFWGRWIRLGDQEVDIMRSCMAECVPGEYICLFPDPDYRRCDKNGRWLPGGNGWIRIPANEIDPDTGLNIREECYRFRDARHDCTPGQYRCFNDGGYNRCGDGGYWSEAGDTSLDFSAFLNHCAFPSRRR